MSDKYSRPLSKFMGVQSEALVNEKMKRKKIIGRILECDGSPT